MKIMALCGSGLGSSFMVEMNIKKILTKIGVQSEVGHSDLASATNDMADLFILGKDLAPSASKLSKEKVIVLESIISIPELEEKLKTYFNK